MKCLECNIETLNPKFCSRRCAAKNTNKIPKRKRTKSCKICGAYILSDRKKCPECIKNNLPIDYTLSECIYEKHHRSSAYALVRTRARAVAKKLGWNSCRQCGYDKHVEIAHIKPIADFSIDTKVSEINNPNNLLPLCPNCHWEYDHQK